MERFGKKAALDSGVHPEAITPEGAFKLDYDVEVLDTIMPGICYTPTALLIEELEVINLSLVLGKIYVYVSQGNQTFKINLRDTILSDAKAITSLTRKMSIQKSNTPPHVDQTKLASVTSFTIRSRLMKFTYVELRFVESVEALTSEEDSIPPVKRRRPSTPTPAGTLPSPLLKQIETSPEEASSGSKETRLLKSPPQRQRCQKESSTC